VRGYAFAFYVKPSSMKGLAVLVASYKQPGKAGFRVPLNFHDGPTWKLPVGLGLIYSERFLCP